jgi:glycerophosphoryl diester phosphodiesterase
MIESAPFSFSKKAVSLFIILIFALSAICQEHVNIAQPKNCQDDAHPLIVGHRGGFDVKLPENSMALFDFTFQNACLQPIAVEFDIRESASGSLFVMHDSTVDRTTNGSGIISLLSDNYIKTLFLKDRNGNLTNEKIPLFSEVLEHFQGKNCMLMLDVKGKIYPKVIRMVSEMNMGSKCIALTFNLNNTKLVKENSSEILISALVLNKTDWDALLKLRIPSHQLIAYVNNETPPELINEICQSKVLVMTDMSESFYNNSEHYDYQNYKDLIAKMHLGIIISDYPLFVSKLYCRE